MSLLGSLVKMSSNMMNVGKGLAQALTGNFSGGSADRINSINSSVPQQDNSDQYTAEILGSIYKLMVMARTGEVLHREEMKNREQELHNEEEQRNTELIKALSVRRPQKPKEETKQKNKQKKSSNQQKKDISKAEKDAGNLDKVTKVPKAPKIPKETVTKVPSVPTAVVGAVATGGLLAMASSAIAKEEGLPKKGKAYWDPPNQKKLVSIGYGHQIKDEEYKQGYIQIGDEKVPLKGDRGIDTVLTQPQAQKLLQNDVPKYENAAKKPLGDSWNKLNDVQKSALISYSYNTGSTQSLVKAGIKDAIDSGDMKRAATIIKEKGIKTAGGVYNEVLAHRREKEAAMFLSKETAPATPAIPVIPPNTGVQIDTSSKINKEMKAAAEVKSQVNVNNTTISNSSNQSNQQVHQQEDVDDRPAIFRK